MNKLGVVVLLYGLSCSGTAWGQTSGDPRRIGVRPTGSYWGASGEQIDLVSGNLNFWMPLFIVKMRGGANIPFGLSYNSQLWRENSAGTTNLGQDVGFGYGWKLQAGSVLPVYSGSTLDHYVYSDSAGAQYRLDQNTNNVWTSREGIYVSYDATANQLHFPDGTFWIMGDTSGPSEADAGTLYPTVIEDSNGNQILLDYLPNINQSNGGSARLYAIADPRASSGCGGAGFIYYKTFYFVYDSTSHLTNTWDCNPGTGGSHTLSYSAPQTLTSPFSSQTFGSARFLQTVTMFDNRLQSFTYGTSGEMATMTTPLSGSLGWQYRKYTYGNGVSYREVQTRTMTPTSGGSTYTWNLTPDNNPVVHGSTTLADAGAGTQKVWTFQTAFGAFTGLVTGYDERGTSGASLLHKDYAWAQDSVGNVYLGTAATTLDPGQTYAVQTKTVQSLDTYGNVLQSQLYDYGATAPTRTYTYTYLTSVTYTSRYMRNRMLTASVQDANGQTSLGSSTYDYGYNSTCSSPDPPTDRPGLFMHDTNYTPGFTCRGMPTAVTGVGTSVVERSYDYDIGGVPTQTRDAMGLATSLSATASTNYSLPEVVTPNGNSNLATTLSYTNFWAVNSIVTPNGATSTTNYDSYGRPSSTTIADGATTNYAYSYNPNTQTATLTDSQSSRWTKTIVDGFGRTVSVIKGHDSVTVSEVDTQYAPCACSPLGKMSKVSQPYASGGTPVWTSYTYDGGGRTLTVTAPDGSVTRYSYQGNSTTVTDPAGKWKTYTADASGNTVSVTEPNPAGGANFVTSYTYNAINKLTTAVVTRPEGTQQRTFVWIGNNLMSATNPENGATSYTYNSLHQVASRTDAKGQQTQYSYDSYNRLKEVRHYYPTRSYPYLQEDPNQRWDYYYDTNPLDPNFPAQNTWGRLAAVQFPTEQTNLGTFSYEYSYNPAGRVTLQRLQASPATAHLDASYAWDNEGRVTSLTYPLSGPTYGYAFDTMGRLSTMTENGVQVASTGYNWAGQMTSLYYDSIGETRTYDPQTMQLTRILTTHWGNSMMDMSYKYTAGQNNGRITQSVDGVSGETVNYTYDALNRLTKAQATSNSWGNAYTYDGFGNLTAATVTAGSAPNFSVNVDPATNRLCCYSWPEYDANGNPGYYNGESQIGTLYDVENRLLNWTASMAYDPFGKRVAQGNSANGAVVYFYGISGQRLGTYSLPSGATTFSTASLSLYFGGKLMRSGGLTTATDRLGSVRATINGNYGAQEQMTYWPYGQERTSTPDGREKFGTYFRDSGAGQDYADQRYYTAIAGRFYTPDPSTGVDLKNPVTWNKYVYTGDDPINFRDPRGLMMCLTCDDDGGGGPDPGFGGPPDPPSDPPFPSDPGPGGGGPGLPFAPKNKPPLRFGGDVTKIFQQAWSTAWADLNKGPCASDFGKPGAQLQSTLENATYQDLIVYVTDPTDPKFGQPNPNVIAATNQSTQTVTINQIGGFANFTGSVLIQMLGQTASVSADQYRTFALLHELGHLVGFGAEIDANQYNNAFNKGILQDCLGVKFH